MALARFERAEQAVTGYRHRLPFDRRVAMDEGERIVSHVENREFVRFRDELRAVERLGVDGRYQFSRGVLQTSNGPDAANAGREARLPRTIYPESNTEYSPQSRSRLSGAEIADTSRTTGMVGLTGEVRST